MDDLINFFSEDLSWKYEGACVNAPIDLFFDGYLKDSDVAASVDDLCSSCPVKQECMKYAKKTEATGVWSGMYLQQGKYHRGSNNHKPKSQMLAEEKEYKNA